MVASMAHMLHSASIFAIPSPDLDQFLPALLPRVHDHREHLAVQENLMAADLYYSLLHLSTTELTKVQRVTTEQPMQPNLMLLQILRMILLWLHYYQYCDY